MKTTTLTWDYRNLFDELRGIDLDRILVRSILIDGSSEALYQPVPAKALNPFLVAAALWRRARGGGCTVDQARTTWEVGNVRTDGGITPEYAYAIPTPAPGASLLFVRERADVVVDVELVDLVLLPGGEA